MAAILARKNTMWYINALITLALMLLFRFLPAPSPITPYGMAVAGIFIGMIYGWCTVNFFYPSMLALILIGFTPFTTPDGAVALLFSNAQVLQCIFLMLATAILNTTGVTNYLANWIINRRIIKNRPWLLIIFLMLATTAIGLIANIAGVVFIMWPLVHQIFKKVGYEKGDVAPAFILVGVVLIGNGANLLMPFQIPVVATFGFLFSASGGTLTSFNGMSYLALSIVVFLISNVLYFIVIRFAAHIDVTKLRNYEPEPESVPKMNKVERLGFILVIALFVLLLAPSIFPAGTALGSFFKTFGTVGPCMLVIGIACVVMFKDGQLFVRFQQLADGIGWGMIFMFGTATALSGALNSEETGIIAFFNGLLAPVFGNMNPIIFVAIFLLIGLIATNVLNNSVVSAVMIPIAYTLCSMFNMNSLALTAMFTIIVTYGLFFPSGSPAGAAIYDNDGWITRRRIYSWVGIYLAICYVVMVVVGYPISNVLF